MINLIRTIRFILHWDFINYTAADTFQIILKMLNVVFDVFFLGSQEFGRFHVPLLDRNHSQCLREVALPFVQRVQEIEVNRQ